MEVLDRCRDRLLYKKQNNDIIVAILYIKSEKSLVLLWLLGSNSSKVSLL